MSALVMFDSSYGNTERLASAIAAGIPGGAVVRRSAELGPDALRDVRLLVVGSPTHGGQPTGPLNAWLSSLPTDALRGVAVAAFDTRVNEADQNFAVRALLKVVGYAASKLAGALTARGGRLVAPAEGFFVEGREGPLKAGEIERAIQWAAGLST